MPIFVKLIQGKASSNINTDLLLNVYKKWPSTEQRTAQETSIFKHFFHTESSVATRHKCTLSQLKLVVQQPGNVENMQNIDKWMYVSLFPL